MGDERRHNREQEDNRPLAELISAYLDDRESLSSDDLDRIELLLVEDPTARQVHAEIGVIRQELRSLDSIQAPRSYHLNAEMVKAREPVVLQETSAWYVRQAATVRWATSAAAVLFVFVLGADLVLNSVFSGPADSTDTSQMDQSAILSRQGDEEAGTGAADMEAVEDESGDDAGGGGAEGLSIVTPEVASDGEEGTDPAALAPALGGENEDAADGASDDADAGSDDSAANDSTLAFDADAASDVNDSSDRRLWRIAEFSLVVILGLLITAMVVLPRIGGISARSASE